MDVNNEADIAKADALVQLRKAVDNGGGQAELRPLLAEALDQTNPGWREDVKIVDRIKVVGVIQASKGLLRTHGV